MDKQHGIICLNQTGDFWEFNSAQLLRPVTPNEKGKKII